MIPSCIRREGEGRQRLSPAGPGAFGPDDPRTCSREAKDNFKDILDMVEWGKKHPSCFVCLAQSNRVHLAVYMLWERIDWASLRAPNLVSWIVRCSPEKHCQGKKSVRIVRRPPPPPPAALVGRPSSRHEHSFPTHSRRPSRALRRESPPLHIPPPVTKGTLHMRVIRHQLYTGHKPCNYPNHVDHFSPLERPNRKANTKRLGLTNKRYILWTNLGSPGGSGQASWTCACWPSPPGRSRTRTCTRPSPAGRPHITSPTCLPISPESGHICDIFPRSLGICDAQLVAWRPPGCPDLQWTTERSHRA